MKDPCCLIGLQGLFLSTNSYDKVADLMHVCVQRDYFSVSPMTTSQ